MTTQKEKYIEPPFEERALSHNIGAEAELIAMAAAPESEFEKLESEFGNGILCVDKKEVYDVCMGTGGPAYGYRIYVKVVSCSGGMQCRHYGNQRQPTHDVKEFAYATSYFQDWGTPKEEYVLSDEAAQELLRHIYIEGLSE